MEETSPSPNAEKAAICRQQSVMDPDAITGKITVHSAEAPACTVIHHYIKRMQNTNVNRANDSMIPTEAKHLPKIDGCFADA